MSFSLFAGGMLVLVAAPNLIQLIVGWELVGVASYLLIAHYWEDFENVDAGNKAFMVNKVADAGLFLGAIIMAVSVGSFRFNDIIDVVVHGEEGMLSQYAFWAGSADLHRRHGQVCPVPAFTCGSLMPWRARRRCRPSCMRQRW